MSNTCTRPARAEDCPAVGQIAQEAYAPYLSRMDRKPFPMLDDYAAHIARGHVFVVEKKGQIAAYVVLLPSEKGLLLDNIGVSPSFQGQGLGKLLVRFAERHALDMGLYLIHLYQ